MLERKKANDRADRDWTKEERKKKCWKATTHEEWKCKDAYQWHNNTIMFKAFEHKTNMKNVKRKTDNDKREWGARARRPVNENNVAGHRSQSRNRNRKVASKWEKSSCQFGWAMGMRRTTSNSHCPRTITNCRRFEWGDKTLFDNIMEKLENFRLRMNPGVSVYLCDNGSLCSQLLQANASRPTTKPPSVNRHESLSEQTLNNLLFHKIHKYSKWMSTMTNID